MESKYEDRVVLFLDILGFKRLIDKKREDIVDEVLAVTATQYSENIQVSAFSDNVAVSMKIDKGCELLQLIQFSSYLAWLLLHKGVLSRGGIATGKLHHKNGIIYGPALIDAYLLESQVAIYPRIILDHQAVPNFLKIHGDHKCICENAIQLQLKKDFDDWNFVHLMGHTATIPTGDLLSGNEKSINGAIDHQALIEAKVTTARRALENSPSTDPRSQSKHQWMKRYIDHYENAFHHAPTFGRLEDAVLMLSSVPQTTDAQIAPAFKKIEWPIQRSDMPTKATHNIDRESHERYVNTAQYAMFRFQMIEEALKTYIFHAHEVVQSRLPSEINFDYKASEYGSMPLERLLSVFAKFTRNKSLFKQLSGLREMRNYVAHRAFFYSTLSVTSDQLNFSEEFAKVQKALSMADAAADALLDEVESIAALAQRMKEERCKT